MKVYLYPHRLTIQPEYVSGPIKYAPKYAAASPEPCPFVTPRVSWKCLLRTSRRPYANPQRKKRIVTSDTGTIDCLVVIREAPVTFLLLILFRRMESSSAPTTDGLREDWLRVPSFSCTAAEVFVFPILFLATLIYGRIMPEETRMNIVRWSKG